MNSIFLEMGGKELRFMKNSGFYFGVPAGLILVLILHSFPYWWVLPLGGVVIGYVVNFIAVWAVFEPIEPKRIGPWRLQGLFIKRQPEAGACFADIVARKIITIENIGEELLHGASADRTRAMVRSALRPAIDQAVGNVRPLIRMAVGPDEYDAIRETVALEGVEYTITPLQDADFNKEQSKRIQKLIAERMREMDSHDFSEMLRSVVKQDEWLPIAHGAVLGIVGGGLHALLFPG